MKTFPKILETWSCGDHLEDEEMIWLRQAYQGVVDATGLFGVQYQLVALNALQLVQVLDGFLKSRGVQL